MINPPTYEPWSRGYETLFSCSIELAFLYLVAEKITCSAMFSKKEFAILNNSKFIGRTNFMLSWGQISCSVEDKFQAQLSWAWLKFNKFGAGICGPARYRLCYGVRLRTPIDVWIHLVVSAFITKTRLFEYIENFTTKNWKFSDKNSDIFHISAQNIGCGYSLEPPRRGGSNEYQQSMFLSRNKKNN